MTELSDYCTRSRESTWAGYYCVLGDAYYVLGNMSEVCDAYFRAGDIHFDNKNYSAADWAYTKGRG